VAPACLKEEIDQTTWLSLAPHIQILYFEGLNPDQVSMRKITEAAKKAKACLYCSYNAWRFTGQQELIQQLTQISPLTIALAVRDPQDVSYLKTAHVVLCTFSPVSCSLQAAFDHLTGVSCSSNGG
jgi:beta-N-acetylhexosaminidase